MPELPEVEVVRAGLEPAAAGATVDRVEVLEPRSLRRHQGPSEDFVERLTGATFAAPERRGKFYGCLCSMQTARSSSIWA